MQTRKFDHRLCLIAALAITVISPFSFSQPKGNAKLPALTTPGADPQHTLIVYLSRTNNTKAVAEIIHDAVGGSLVALELKTPYPENYDAIVTQVQRENETGFLPPLATRIPNIKQYDTVFIGFPTWGMRLPPPIKSFLHDYDLSGKTVIPFNTNGGYGLGSSIQQIEKLCPDSRILEAFSTRGGLERDGVYLAITGRRRNEVRVQVAGWLKDIKVLNRNPEPQAGARPALTE